LIKKLAHAAGMEAFKRQPDFHYAPDVYGKTWFKLVNIRELPVFGDMARRVRDEGRTRLYYDRLYTHYQAVQNAAKTFPDGLSVAEIGVFKGGTSMFMARLLQQLQVPNPRVYAIDTFEGHAAEDINPNADDATKHTAGKFNDTDYEAVRDYLAAIPFAKVIKGRIQDTYDQIDPGPLHVVHMDVDLYEPTAWMLPRFHERLPVGGVMVLDDFHQTSCPGIVKAAEDFLAEHPQYFTWHDTAGQLVMVKMR
jgi:predicted O-methyltransferase YrrM